MLTLSTVAGTTRPEINGGDRNLSWTNAATGGRTPGRRARLARSRGSQQARFSGGGRGRRGGPPVVFDLDGGARHRRQGARRASVMAELARVRLDPENGEKERGKQGREGERRAAGGASISTCGGRGAGVVEHGVRDTAAWRHAVHCGDRGEMVLQISPCIHFSYLRKGPVAF